VLGDADIDPIIDHKDIDITNVDPTNVDPWEV
jgi:hypothetical protein